METDEHFEPDCPKCPIVFLDVENELAMEVYAILGSEVVVAGNLQNWVIKDYIEEIIETEGSFRNMLTKLSLIHEVASQFKGKAEPDVRPPGIPPPKNPLRVIQ